MPLQPRRAIPCSVMSCIAVLFATSVLVLFVSCSLPPDSDSNPLAITRFPLSRGIHRFAIMVFLFDGFFIHIHCFAAVVIIITDLHNNCVFLLLCTTSLFVSYLFVFSFLFYFHFCTHFNLYFIVLYC